MNGTPLELNFRHIADGQLGLLRTQAPLDCTASPAEGFAGSMLATRLQGDLLVELHGVRPACWQRRAAADAQPRQLAVLWQLSGRSHVEQGGRRTLLDAGDWTALDPAQPHRIDSGERSRFMLLWTRAARFDTGVAGWPALCAARLDGRGPSQVALAALGALLRSGSVALSAQSAATLHEAVQALLARALGQALDAHGLVGATTTTTMTTTAAAPRSVGLAQLQAHIREHLMRPELGPDQLAEVFGISRRSVYKLFEPLGVTPHQFIQNSRIERALQLLADTAWRGVPIAGIGRHCGFADAAHFSKAVRARTGRAPSALRETTAAA